MLIANTMRFGTDEFIFDRRAFLIAKVPWDTVNQTSVEGFTIGGSQPTDTERRIIFKVDDKLWKFVDGQLTEFTGTADFESVLADGNTVAELEAVTSIPQWLNKKIYPIVALGAPVDANSLPTIKIALNVRAATDLYDKTDETVEYELTSANSGATPRIADIVTNVTCTGEATCTVTCSVKNLDGSWSAYLPIADVKNRECTAVKFQIKYHVTEIGGADSAKLDSITIRHNLGTTVVSGDTADLYSIVQNYGNDLQTCQLIVKHKKLVDSEIHAFVNFMEPPKTRERIILGVSDGTRQQFALGVDGVKDTGINHNTLRVFVNGTPISNFGYNMEVSEITVDAENGQTISASYEYGHDVEEWTEMEQVVASQPYLNDGTFMSKFSYTLPDEEAVGKKISNIRIKLYRPSGRVENETLGTANGLVQQFVLPHAAKQTTIVCPGEWTYDDNSKVLTVVAPKGTPLVISYDYLGESQKLYSFVAAWIARV